MNLKIGWEIASNGDITEVNKQGNKLYANSRASVEYFLIADDYLLTDTAIINISHSDKDYSYQMFYGEIILENGDIKNGWYCISNGDELRVDLSIGTITATVSFNIKRFSTVDDNELVVDYTSQTDTILIYPGSRYYPEAEASDVELIENDISLLQTSKLDKVFDNENGTVQTFANTSAGATITKTDGVDTTILEVKADGVYINDLEINTGIDNKISAHNLDTLSHPSLISEINNIKDGTTTVKKAEQDENGNNIANSISELNNKIEEHNIDIEAHADIRTEIINLRDDLQDGDIMVGRALYDDNYNVISSKYQKKTDNTLETTDKTVVGAINELKDNKLNKSAENIEVKTDITLDVSGVNLTSNSNDYNSYIDLDTENVEIYSNKKSTDPDLIGERSTINVDPNEIKLVCNGEVSGINKLSLTLNTLKYNNSQVATETTIADLFKDVTYNSTTGELTFTAFNDSTKVIDLPLELILDTSGSYYDSGVIYLKLANGEFLQIDVADLIDTYTAGDGIDITDGVISLTEATKLDNLDLQSASVTDNVLTITKADNTEITFTDNNTTYENATDEVDGLMSASDKTRLDNIEENAQLNIIEDIKVNNVSLEVDGKAVNIDLSGYLTTHQDITNKADKVNGADSGNFAGLDSVGNLIDSGSKASDFLTTHQDITGKEDTSNKVTSLSAESTDLEYPSAKCVYDIIGDIETLLSEV